mgnify:CR=1 FL=1
MYELIRQAKARTVGTRAVLRAVERGEARVVFVARDAEPRVVAPVVALCGRKGVQVVWVDSMTELGRACGIEVGAASAAVLE